MELRDYKQLKKIFQKANLEECVDEIDKKIRFIERNQTKQTRLF